MRHVLQAVSLMIRGNVYVVPAEILTGVRLFTQLVLTLVLPEHSSGYCIRKLILCILFDCSSCSNEYILYCLHVHEAISEQ